MTDRLTEIRERWAKATPGPWAWCEEGEYNGDSGWRWLFGPEKTEVLGAAGMECAGGDIGGSDENEAAIAAAPADIAWLLERVEMLGRLVSVVPFGDGYECAYCDRKATMNPETHDSACLWRQARELLAGEAVTESA